MIAIFCLLWLLGEIPAPTALFLLHCPVQLFNSKFYWCSLNAPAPALRPHVTERVLEITSVLRNVHWNGDTALDPWDPWHRTQSLFTQEKIELSVSFQIQYLLYDSGAGFVIQTVTWRLYARNWLRWYLPCDKMVSLNYWVTEWQRRHCNDLSYVLEDTVWSICYMNTCYTGQGIDYRLYSIIFGFFGAYLMPQWRIYGSKGVTIQ